MRFFEYLGQIILNSFANAREFIQLFAETVASIFVPPFRYKEILRHIYFIGNESAPIVFICVAFAASVTIIETSFHMKIVIQNDSMVPGFASILILRELGSVISCLLIGSRVGVYDEYKRATFISYFRSCGFALYGFSNHGPQAF